MRLWSLHPQYLDTVGLTACWREGLLARHVVLGKTKGYKHHPQLQRFQACDNPLQALDIYLQAILVEARNRNFKYDDTKINTLAQPMILKVTKQQLYYEFEHLKNKFAHRNPDLYNQLLPVKEIVPHPMFEVVKGEIESWEIVDKIYLKSNR